MALLREALGPFARRLAAGQQIIHLPRLIGLRQQEPGLIFHAVPEIFFQLTGSNRFTCPSEKFTLLPDEIGVVSRWLPHGERFHDTAKVPFSGIVIGLDAGLATFRWQCPGDDSRPSSAWTLPIAGPASDQLARYLDDLAAQRQLSPLFHYSLLHTVVVLMLELLRPASIEQEAAHPLNSQKVQRCREIIQAELSDPALSVSRLARDLRCTPGHLSRLFREECGVALNAYLREERLRHAQHLLTDPSLNVSEIAWACGFRSPNYFIRRFRAAYGFTPGTLQRVHVER